MEELQEKSAPSVRSGTFPRRASPDSQTALCDVCGRGYEHSRLVFILFFHCYAIRTIHSRLMHSLWVINIDASHLEQFMPIWEYSCQLMPEALHLLPKPATSTHNLR